MFTLGSLPPSELLLPWASSTRDKRTIRNYSPERVPSQRIAVHRLGDALTLLVIDRPQDGRKMGRNRSKLGDDDDDSSIRSSSRRQGKAL